MNERNSGFTNFQDALLTNTGTKTDALGRVFPLGTFFDPATTRQVAAGATDLVSGLTNPSSAAIYVRDPFYSGGSVAGVTNFTGAQQYLNQLPAGRLDANAQKLLALYPLPTLGTPHSPNYYQFAGSTNNLDQYDVRIDEHISQRDFLFGVFDRSVDDIYVPPPLPGIADGQSFGDGPVTGPRYAIALGYTHLFSPTLTNEAHAGWNHSIEHIAGPYGSTLGLPAQYGIGGVPQAPGNGGLPPISVGGFTGLGSATYTPTLETTTTLEIMDNLTKVLSTHTIKAGYQIDNFHAPIIQPTNGRGSFNFSGAFSDIQTGAPASPVLLTCCLCPPRRSFPAASREWAASQATASLISPR